MLLLCTETMHKYKYNIHTCLRVIHIHMYVMWLSNNEISKYLINLVKSHIFPGLNAVFKRYDKNCISTCCWCVFGFGAVVNKCKPFVSTTTSKPRMRYCDTHYSIYIIIWMCYTIVPIYIYKLYPVPAYLLRV